MTHRSKPAQVSAAVLSHARRAIASGQLSSLMLPEELPSSAVNGVTEPASHQKKDDQDNHDDPYDAEAAATIVPAAVAVISAAKAAEEQDQQNNNQ
jgi:hypothetical protein